jgi:hypothetical protein
MKKIIGFVLAFLSLSNIASAFGYFGKNHDALDVMGMHGFGLFAGFGLAVLAAAAFLFFFWLWMLIDCLKRDFKKDYEKIVWVLVMIFLHLLGAIIYYFVVKVSDKKGAKEKKK